MNVNVTSSYRQTSDRYTTATHQAGSGRNDGTSGSRVSSQATEDYVSISDEAIKLGDEARGGTIIQAGKSVHGATGKGVRKYLNIGSGNGNITLDTMNASRKALGARIDMVVRSSGIKLGKNDKLSISIDKNNQIVVGGIKNKKKAEEIQLALNEDTKLGQDLRRHAAVGIINANAKRQAVAEANGMKADTEDLFTNRAVRAFVIDDYLKQNAATDLSALSLEKDKQGNDVLVGLTEELTTLIGEDPELGDTLTAILKNGERELVFEASFEFANGVLSDSASANAAKDKVDGVKAVLMGGTVPGTATPIDGIINNLIRQLKETDADPELIKMLGKGFSIRVSANGDYDIVGAEDMNKHLVMTLKSQIDKALEKHCGVGANFADVAEIMIEQHKFEHGDTDEFEHMVEIDFGSTDGAIKVVSPEADKAQDANNKQLAGQLGEALREMLDDQGIDTSKLKMVVADDGIITVQGDPQDANVKKAQSILDQFTMETKQTGKAKTEEKKNEAEEAEKKTEARDEAARIRQGKGKEQISENGQLHVSVTAEKKTDPVYEGSVSRILDFPKYDQNTQNISDVAAVSTVTPIWEQDAVDETEKVMPGEQKGKGKKRAAALYRELLQGMGNFHDARPHVSYRLAA